MAEDSTTQLEVSAQHPKPQTIPFFKLCAKLRTMILEECLVVGKVFPRPNPKYDRRLPYNDEYEKPISQLLCVSRQMRKEASEIFLQNNMFVISCGQNSWPWSTEFGPSTETLDSLHDLATKYVRHLSICFDIRDYPGNDQESLERANDNEYWETIHDEDHTDQEYSYICPSWAHRHEHYRLFSLVTLEADFNNYVCSRGCCDYISSAIDDYLFDWTAPFPKHIIVRDLLSAWDAHRKYDMLFMITGVLDYLLRLTVDFHARPCAEFILYNTGPPQAIYRLGASGESIENYRRRSGAMVCG